MSRHNNVCGYKNSTTAIASPASRSPSAPCSTAGPARRDRLVVVVVAVYYYYIITILLLYYIILLLLSNYNKYVRRRLPPRVLPRPGPRGQTDRQIDIFLFFIFICFLISLFVCFSYYFYLF